VFVKNAQDSERAFYRDVYPSLNVTKLYIPRLVRIEGEQIVLQNVTFGMKNPCIADLKLGQAPYGTNLPKERLERR